MKFRTDFVTNSSSSSFILSFKERNNDELTIEDAYQLIYKMYIKHYDFVMSVIDYINSDSKSKMCFDEHGYLRYKNGKYEFNDKGNEKYWNKLKKKFGKDLSEYDINAKKVEWVPLCPTYKDYSKYWTERLYSGDEPNYATGNYGPFSICDYRADTYEALHYRAYDYNFETDESIYHNSPIEKVDKSIDNDELGWYFNYIEEFLKDENFEPPKYSWFDEEEYAEEVKEHKDVVKLIKETKNNELVVEVALDGRFAILSESGYIPESIVDKLREECKYSCNHMG